MQSGGFPVFPSDAQRAMLAILSDLHLNDGTTGSTLSPGAMGLFAERLGELAAAASWRADDRYRPIEQIDLVLLGDVLDPLASTLWARQPAVRPWRNPLGPDVAELVARITAGILAENGETLAALRGLAEKGIRVPPMLRAARPGLDGEEHAVPVRIHYMVGEHDWFYHLDGEAYHALRQTVVAALGLLRYSRRPFPYEIGEREELLLAMRRHRVTARHGDVYDPLACGGERDSASPTDAIQIELVNRFPPEVAAVLGDDLPAATAMALRGIDAVRPLVLLPVWLDGLLERTCRLAAVRRQIRRVWERLVEELLAGDGLGGAGAAGLVDGLRRVLLPYRHPPAGPSAAALRWLRDLRDAAGDSYAAHAPAEQDFRSRRARHVVYGHTHAAEIVPLDASHADGCVLDQVYFNAGTWRRVWRPAEFSPGQTDFLASDAMTYLVFYQDDERKGRPYETWSGSLGRSPSEWTIRRLDIGRLDSAGGPPAAGCLPPPHFSSSSSAVKL
jgi:hypothetical protein